MDYNKSWKYVHFVLKLLFSKPDCWRCLQKKKDSFLFPEIILTETDKYNIRSEKK